MQSNPKCHLVVMVAAVVLGGLGAAQDSVASQDRRTAVAVLDLQKLFGELKEKRQADVEEADRRRGLREEEQERKTAIAQLQQDLDELKPGEESHQEKQEQIAEALIEYQAWLNFQNLKLNSDRRLRDLKIYNKAVESIGRVATDNGFDLVLFRSQRLNVSTGQGQQQQAANIAIVAWASDSIDITDQVVQRMNNEFDAAR